MTFCGQCKPLRLYMNKDIGELLEIEPDGSPEYRCEDCIKGK